ncbi:MAG: tRNA (adenosine(37)-N6)-threonylcarbamoyltransferase complex dimerization subunit type 1 TsaB [Firmicutes bacterium]|nr:tRNA (adenosine(37)-N6)-threonylcarbamoyltransferase complex dimerization subunit type 1 TsaB [Bacillota bacterium]
MNILAISTGAGICSAALLKDTDIILELNIEGAKIHSENLMPLIDELLTKSNMKLSDIDLIGVDNGPGSFTGIRIGVSTVKGLAAPSNIPIVPVSSLEALSYNIHAGNVGRAAYKKYKEGFSETADSVMPLYLKPSQAEQCRNAGI